MSEIGEVVKYLKGMKEISIRESNMAGRGSWEQGYALGSIDSYESAITRLERYIKQMAEVSEEPESEHISE